MIKKIKSMINSFKGQRKTRTDFSDFFHNASAGQKKKLLLEVTKEANEDQKKLIERYNRISGQTA